MKGPWFQYHDVVGFEWNSYELKIPDLPTELDGFRILHLSDLHCQPHWQIAYDDLFDRLDANEPDLILITGDIVDYITRPQLCLPTAHRFLQRLRAPAGIFGILGNHDRNLYPGELSGTPMRLMDGQRHVIQARNKSIELIAAQGPEREDYVPGSENNHPAKISGIPRIILSHYPDHLRKMKVLKPDLFLSGHTHGGQACLPGGVAVLRHDSLPLHLLKGVHRYADTWLVVSRGFGFSTLPFRLFCPAEVIEIVLRKEVDHRPVQTADQFEKSRSVARKGNVSSPL